MKSNLQLIPILLYFFIENTFANISVISGNINFDINSDSNYEASLSSTGLGVGTSASANLHISGNAIISNHIRIGSGTSGVSTFEIGGSIGFDSISYGPGSNTLGNSAFFIADTSAGNVLLNLPDASSYLGRVIHIKRTSTLNSLYLSGLGNLIDNYTTLEFLSGNLSSLQLLSNGTQWYIMARPTSETLQEIGTQNLYLWWKLDETSGNTASSEDNASHSGNLTNNHSFSGNSVTGIFQNALLLDNETDTITHETSSLNSNGYSYSFWMKTSKTPTDTIDIEPVISGPAGFCLASSNTFYNQSAYHQLNDNSYITSKISSTISANTWYHIAVSWNGGELKSYLNGSYESGNTASSWIGASNIIASHPGSFSSSNLILDDIRYFSNALDSEAIQGLYHGGRP